ncbi:MAG: hypothetical protein CME64_00165 [Halobacteriovoraceae bacterium]|nr:hypothetical protein [Halobacteriovoraceae bacterium]|tara:strand:- start:42749 stop:43756 length:1008 start_codon:yes stop_codon:yes gene_type:complete
MKLLIAFFLSFSLHAVCVHEKTILGAQLPKLQKQYDVYAQTEEGSFKKLTKAISIQRYNVQLLPKSEKSFEKSGPFDRYNRKYVEYYTYPRMVKYLDTKREGLDAIGYQIQTVGKSLKGRNLFYVGPKTLDPTKKTIVMFGRHHGDEGTANWIIEGFLNQYINDKSFSDEFQLVLYPMVNPDGAMKKSRYNANGRDLNRSWDKELGEDEIVSIHGHLAPMLKKLSKVVIALDMHGSFEEDFIYRVKRSYKGEDFYNLQQKFIDELGIYDSWQNGNFHLSNGHPKMARLVLVTHYNLHALTHETIRNIRLKNRRGRTKQSLIEQGEAVVTAISNLY